MTTGRINQVCTKPMNRLLSSKARIREPFGIRNRLWKPNAKTRELTTQRAHNQSPKRFATQTSGDSLCRSSARKRTAVTIVYPMGMNIHKMNQRPTCRSRRPVPLPRPTPPAAAIQHRLAADAADCQLGKTHDISRVFSRRRPRRKI